MTLDDALHELRDLIGEPGPMRHRDPDLTDMLEQGQGMIAGLSLGDERILTITQATSPQLLIAGQREFHLRNLEEDGGLSCKGALRVMNVHWDGEALERTTPEQWPTLDVSSANLEAPAYYYEFAGWLGLIPAPDAAALSAFTCEIHYAAWSGAWASGESTLMPPYHALIVPWATMLASIRTKHWDRVGMMFVETMQDLSATTKIEERRDTHHSDMRQPPTERQRKRTRR